MPAYNIAPLINYHFSTKAKVSPDYYVGFSPVYFQYLGMKLKDINGNNAGHSQGANGYGLELRTGTVVPVYKRWSLFGEASGGIADQPHFRERAQVFTASVCIGIKIRLNDAANK